METKKKYQIDFDEGNAIYQYTTPKGHKHISRFIIFTDSIGLKIFTRQGVVYLTEKNSEVI